MYSILNDWHCNCQRLKSVAFANLFENSIYIFIFGSLCHAELPRRSSVRLRVYVLVAYRKAKVYSKCSWKNVKSTMKKWSKLFKSVFKVSLVTCGRVSGKILTGCDVGWCEKSVKSELRWRQVLPRCGSGYWTPVVLLCSLVCLVRRRYTCSAASRYTIYYEDDRLMLFPLLYDARDIIVLPSVVVSGRPAAVTVERVLQKMDPQGVVEDPR